MAEDRRNSFVNEVAGYSKETDKGITDKCAYIELCLISLFKIKGELL
jgi:hypothetical protein